MNNILVPCDFSPPAINAFRFALDIVQTSRGTIHLLHVIDPVSATDSTVLPVLDEVMMAEAQKKAEHQFRKLIGNHRLEGVKIVSKIELGGVDQAILEYIANESIDIVLMGSLGASGVREIFVGSNAERIVRKSPVPVLILKEYFWGPITNIVFPNSLELDGQRDLVERVKALQLFFRARLHVVYINTPMNFASDAQTQERLTAFAETFDLQNCTLNIFNHPTHDEGVLAFARQMNADLIAIGTHGRTGLAHLMNGSIAEDVVNHADKLVWTYGLNHVSLNAN